jgi:drug/metabolite transporter (DMT)-like permease
MNINRRHAVAALIAAGLLWGTSVPLSKLALAWLSPGWLTVTRFGLAAAVLLAVAGRPAHRARLRAAFTPKVLVSGALGYGGSVMVQNAGISRTSVTHAALLIGAVPVLVAIIAAVWYRTVARPVAWVGFVVSLLGVGLITAGGGGGGATMAGDGLVLASLLLSAAVTVAQGRLLAGRDPVAVTAVQFLGAAVGALLVTLPTSGAPAMPGGLGPVLALVALTAGGTLAPFTLFAFGQSRVSAEVAGAFLNLEPLVGAIAGAAAFGDPVGLAQAAGGLAIVAGIGLSSLPLLAGRRRPQAGPLAPPGAEALAPAGAGSLAPAGAEALAPAGAGSLAPAGAEALAPAGAGSLAPPGAGSLAPPGAGSPVLASARAGSLAQECDSLPQRIGRESHSRNSGVRGHGVFVVVHGGKFGAGAAGGAHQRGSLARPGGAQPGGASARRGPGPGRAGARARGDGWGPGAPGSRGARPGERVAGRPPARGRGRGDRRQGAERQRAERQRAV